MLTQAERSVFNHYNNVRVGLDAAKCICRTYTRGGFRATSYLDQVKGARFQGPGKTKNRRTMGSVKLLKKVVILLVTVLNIEYVLNDTLLSVAKISRRLFLVFT